MGRLAWYLSIWVTICLLVGCPLNQHGYFEPEDQVINGLRYHLSYNGTIETLSDNSWVFTSHTNRNCINVDSVKCRKIDINYSDYNYSPARVTHHRFELQVVEFNLDFPPNFVIIFQDWVQIYEEDTDGNRPISTLKLESNNHQLYLRHYDNSWQWGSPAQKGNSADLPPNRLNGSFPIEVGVTYMVDFVIYDSGRASLIVNDYIVSDENYQTKSSTSAHAIQWGLYWSKGYNLRHDPLKQIIVRMDNFELPQNKVGSN